MISRYAAAALLLSFSATLASAQAFSGAEISAEVLTFTDDVDLGEKEYRGAVQFGLPAGFGAAADLSYHNSDGLGLGGRNLTFHGFYEGLDLATVGLFYGRDSIDDGDAELVGLEAATTLMGGDIQGALGSYDGDVGSGSLLSVDARYAFGGFAATGFAGAMSGDVDGSRIGLGAEYQLGAGPTLYGEVGRRSVDDDGQTYLSLGARLAVGPNAGTTFESRSIFEILPGF